MAGPPAAHTAHGGRSLLRSDRGCLPGRARRDLLQADPGNPLDKTRKAMFRWYAVNTYSGHENKVKQNLEHRVVSLGQQRNVRQIVIPTEHVSEMKDGQKVQIERRTMPGYVLVNMDLNEDSWTLVKGTPGVTGFVGAQQKPVPLNQTEIDRLLNRETAERPRTRAQFSIGESVKAGSGPPSDFSGESSEVNEDAAKLTGLGSH